MADTLTTDQWYPNVTLKIINDAGDPAPVDGVPVWASSDETVLVAQPDVTGMAGAVQTVATGVARITITADADLGEGVKTLTLVSPDQTVTPGASSQATTMVLDFGAPVEKTPVATPV